MTRIRRNIGERPTCPLHPDGKIHIDRRERASANGLYAAVAYRCVHRGGRHRIKRDFLPRTLADTNPSAHLPCPNCGQQHSAQSGQIVAPPGMFSPKYTFESYMASALGIGWVASAGSLRREAEIGPLAYARELGMTTLADELEAGQRPDAVKSSLPAHPALQAALEALKAVRDQNLITEDEYATKQAEVLARF